MSKQTKMEQYLKGKHPSKIHKESKKYNQREAHNSSREGSQSTQKLDNSNEVVVLETYQSRKLTCPPFLLTTPTVMTYYWKFERTLRELCNNYSQQKVMNFILSNLRFHKIDNLKNLREIKDNDFWGHELPMMIEMVYKHIRQIDSCVRLLLSGMKELLELSRTQVFVILGCMFLGMLPSQCHEDNVHFGQLMTQRENELHSSKAKTRREKLKCFIAYFKHMVKHPGNFNRKIQFLRTRNLNTDFLDKTKMDREVPLRAVEILLIKDKAIEDYCGKGIMVDFANKRLGGGVLRNGCVQEEILFSIFPEALISKIICEQLDEDQAVIIYGARRFSNYTGYADTFQYQELPKLAPESIVSKSIMVAIDATDFSHMPTQNYQYSKKGIRREIIKAVAGFEGAGWTADEDMPIVSGRWGCGAFRGDQDLKLLIQWVATSEANRQLIYITEDEEKMKEYKQMIKQLQHMCTLEIISLLDQYHRVKSSSKDPITVIEYIKRFVA